MDGRDRGAVDLFPPRRGDQVDPRRSEGELAGGGARFLTDKSRHSQDHEEEEDRRSEDQDEQVGIAPGLPGTDSRRDQTRAREKAQPQRREARPILQGRLLECPHGRVQRRRPPEEVVDDPSEVVAELVVVRVGEERIGVGGVHCEERDDAPDEQVEGRGALALIHREPDRRRQEQDVSQWVGGRDRLLERGEAGEVDVRRDEEDPRDETDADGEDQ